MSFLLKEVANDMNLAKKAMSLECAYSELSYSNKLYWRQKIGNRYAVVCTSATKDTPNLILTPKPFSVGTAMYGYGGGSYVVSENGYYFVDAVSGDIYFHPTEDNPILLVKSHGRAIGGLVYISTKNTLIYLSHSKTKTSFTTRIELIHCKSKVHRIILEVPEFIGGLTFTLTGNKCAWYQWQINEMPWDKTSLFIAETNLESIYDIFQISMEIESSKIEPRFANDTLFFLDDCSGWWNIYKWVSNKNEIECISGPSEIEFGFPPYKYGENTYGISNNKIISVATDGTKRRLIEFNQSGYSKEYSWNGKEIISPIINGELVYFISGDLSKLTTIQSLNIANQKNNVIVASAEKFTPSFTAEYHLLNASEQYKYCAFVYWPNEQIKKNNKSHIILNIHGGPNGSVSRLFSTAAEFWTAKGYVYLEIDYVGSTGYGKQFRERLNNQWGEVECENIFHFISKLEDIGILKPYKIFVRGNSAGGYTVMRLLSKSRLFSAGCAYYGVSDLKKLLETTHPFESPLLYNLINKEVSDLTYIERSPLYNPYCIQDPLLLIHGKHDQVVPINQSRLLYQKLLSLGKTCHLLEFEEQHGFTSLDNKALSYAIEHQFYENSINDAA
ncbi:alpha/beta hydrolase family protein [Methylovulum psychrotolerans]|nr:prolyl oligopeptidase family serine peptidase [Methylovulum psychrotolerans]